MGTIAWLPWAAASFARARDEGKPVLLSIAPTWCRNSIEMDRSSFEDPSVVSIVGVRYVPVRVDADRRPDISERYSLGGWPTTVFLTPGGEVLGGGTYVEGARLAEALAGVADAFRAGAHARAGPLRSPSGARSADAPQTIAQLVEQVDGCFDVEHGGFGAAPKFPLVAPVHLALALFRQEASDRHREMAVRSLDAIGWGPLHDDVNGGFFRYSRGADWSSPEEDKLLEVNAALLGLYVDAFETLQLARYGERAEDVVRYVQTWLADPVDGGWAGSQRRDADSGSNLQPTGGVALAAPPIDRTLYSDWNAGMALAALRAGRVLDDPGLSEFAIRSLERIVQLCYQPGGGMAHFHDGAPQVRGLLGDQIAMADAQLEAYEATGNVVYRMLAEELLLHALRMLWDEAAGGFFDRTMDQDDVGRMCERVKPFAGNCVAARVLRRAARLTGRETLTEAADRTVAAVGREAKEAGAQAAELVLALTPPAG